VKIIEQKDWRKTFKYVFTCPSCESKLEAESDDLIHEPGGGDMRESWPEKFVCACPVCAQRVKIPTDGIPSYIAKLARDRKNQTEVDRYR